MSTALKHDPHGGISEAEWQVRTDLAAFHRLYVHLGLTDLIYTHLSARVPGEPNHYLIKQDLLLMEEVTASNLLKMDMDGNLVAGDGPPNNAGHLIHSAVLKARPDLNVLAHTHSRAGTAVASMKCGLLPLSQHSNMILPAVTRHAYQDVTNAADECAALARDFPQPYTILLMENHGLLASGRTVAECFYYLYFMEMACKIQVDVLSSGQEPILVRQEVVDGLFADRVGEDGIPRSARVWPSMLRMLDRKSPDYKD